MIYHAINLINNCKNQDLTRTQDIAVESILKFKTPNTKFVGILDPGCTTVFEFDEVCNLNRTFKTDEGKNLPYVRDYFEILSLLSNDDDWIGFTNSDIIIKSEELYMKLSELSSKVDAVLLNRDEIKTKEVPSSLKDFLNSVSSQNPFDGRDGFFIKKYVWDQIKSDFGDYVVSQPYWDIALQEAINKSFKSLTLNNMILHYFHPKRWFRHSPMAKYNKEIYDKSHPHNDLPLISVIVTVYNKEKYIEETLFTVDRQITKGKFEYEVIIIDDCSNDSSSQIIKDFKWDNASIKNIKVLSNKINEGVSDSYLRGLKESEGDYIVPLDGDDLLTRYSLFFRFEAIKGQEENKWATGQQLVIKDDGGFVVGKEFNRKLEPKNKREFLSAYLSGNFHIPASSVIFKKELLDKIHWIEGMKSSQDFALHIQLGLEDEIPFYFDNYVTIYRYHPDGSEDSLYQSSIKSGQKIRDFKTIYKETQYKLNKEEKELFKSWITKWEKLYQESLTS